MNTKTRPKQFLELYGKPIILYTIEAFENHPAIDGIVVVCLKDWIPFLKKKIAHYDIAKVIDVVPGGVTGQESIRNGLAALGAAGCAAQNPQNDKAASAAVGRDHAVFVHDGVRPLVSDETITRCAESVAAHGNAVSVTPAIETIVQEEGGTVTNIIDRAACRMAKAPQCFNIGELIDAHDRAQADGEEGFIDSASLMRHYGHVLHTVETGPENIKITTPSDFYIFRAFVDARESSEIFGF